MKLRLDLLKYLTMEDIAEVAEANTHRFNPEPLFSKTGTGSLLPATAEERAREVEQCVELVRKLKERARKAENADVSGMKMQAED